MIDVSAFAAAVKGSAVIVATEIVEPTFEVTIVAVAIFGANSAIAVSIFGASIAIGCGRHHAHWAVKVN